ncbi:3'-5' exonuclease, partial [Candidatus Magnetoovum chiemensis]
YMIEHSFSVIEGIGYKTEKRLWSHGIFTWDDFINRKTIPFLSERKKESIDESLNLFIRGLNEKDWSFLISSLDRGEHWRLFEMFKRNAICLDIETSGLSYYCGGYITMVGLYNGSRGIVSLFR